MPMLSPEAEARVIAQAEARLAQGAALADKARQYGEITQTPSGLSSLLGELKGLSAVNPSSNPFEAAVGKAAINADNYYRNTSTLEKLGDAVSLGAAVLPATAAYRTGLAGIMKTPQLAAAGRKFMNDVVTGLARQELEDYIINNTLSGTSQNIAKTIDTTGDTTRTINAVRKLMR